MRPLWTVNGTNNYTLTYDGPGNLTDDGQSYTYKFDAWHRLVEIRNRTTSALVAEYEYYGTNARKSEHSDREPDGDVDASDATVSFACDEGWRLLAAFEGSESAPREEWLPHQAGLDGRGGSSYIDDVILRDRDADGAGGNPSVRLFLLPNWRHDVSAIVSDTGKMIEWAKYESYGAPRGLPCGDTDSDGDWDATNSSAITGSWDARKDAELDGDVDAADITHANSITGSYQTLGRTLLSSTAVKNRKGYAGYERDHSIGVLYHVRFRVLHTTLGRWMRRDPLGYVDGVNLQQYAVGQPITSVDPLGDVPLPVIAIGVAMLGAVAISTVYTINDDCCTFCSPWVMTPTIRKSGRCEVFGLKCSRCICIVKECVDFTRACTPPAPLAFPCPVFIRKCNPLQLAFGACEWRITPPPGMDCDAACRLTNVSCLWVSPNHTWRPFTGDPPCGVDTHRLFDLPDPIRVIQAICDFVPWC